LTQRTSTYVAMPGVSAQRKDIGRYVYDSNGRNTAFELDIDGDGSTNYREAYAYDAQGRMTTIDVDNETVAPPVKTRMTFEYAPDGRQIGRADDTGVDGTIDVHWTITYDELGVRLTDTAPNNKTTYRYVCN